MPEQVISDKVVRATVEDRLEQMLVFRDAFRDLDASDVNSDTIEVPVPVQDMAEPEPIEPGGQYPNSRENYVRVQSNREKYGEMATIPEEDQIDSVFEIVQEHVTGAANKMARKLDAVAYNELTRAVNNNGLGTVNPDGGDALDYDDLIEGQAVLEDQEEPTSPDMAFFGPFGKRDILSYLADRGTDLGDEAVETGQFGAFAGLDFLYSTAGELTDRQAILVDSDAFGYEATWEAISTESEDNFDTDETKYKIKTYKDWMWARDDPELSAAAVLIDG